MITVREAALKDVEGIRAVFESEYGQSYAYPQYYDVDALARLVYTDGTLLLVAVDEETERIAGTASVVFSVGAYNDLVGEFGRLVVHPDYRGRGIGKLLMKARIEHVESRLHVGIVENRTAHRFSQRISSKFGFVPVGFAPMKLLLDRRESVVLFAGYFGDALSLRRNHPRVIPEVSRLAELALKGCGLPDDAIIDDSSAPYPHDCGFDLDELKTQGYSSLLRIERGRVRNREVFGPARLHYGLFQLRARRSDYMIARRDGQIIGGIGYMHDQVEKAVRVFELISLNDAPIRCLLDQLVHNCRTKLGVEYIEVDVSAYAPRMQRTLLELGFLPVGYIPANVFHEVERLDVVKMARLFVPWEVGEFQLSDEATPVAQSVIQSFTDREVLPQVAAASRQTPLFNGLNPAQRLWLLAVCGARSFQPGEAVYCQGDANSEMHLMLKGEVELFRGDQRVATVSAGQCLGETSLLFSPQSTPPHSLTATAKTIVETAVFPNRDFNALIRRHPDIGVVIFRNLAVDVSTKLRLQGERGD